MSDIKTINSIMRASSILRCLSQGKNRLGKISEDLGLSKSTIHRILKTLIAASFVVQDPITSKYYLGPLALELSLHPTISHGVLITCAFEEMKSLRDYTRETVLLHIRYGLERLCVEQFESPEYIKYATEKGAAAPLYVGSAGKILLAALNDDEIQVIFGNINFIPITSHTIIKPEALFEEIYKVRDQGFAVSFGEREVGAASVSVLIRNYVSPVALSVLGPDSRLSINRIKGLIDELNESANRISHNLQFMMGITGTDERQILN